MRNGAALFTRHRPNGAPPHAVNFSSAADLKFRQLSSSGQVQDPPSESHLKTPTVLRGQLHALPFGVGQIGAGGTEERASVDILVPSFDAESASPLPAKVTVASHANSPMKLAKEKLWCCELSDSSSSRV